MNAFVALIIGLVAGAIIEHNRVLVGKWLAQTGRAIWAKIRKKP